MEVVEKIKTQIVRSIFFSPEIRAVYETVWKDIVERDGPHMTVWRVCILCWIRKGTSIPSEYVIFLLFHRNSGCTNASQYYVIRTLPVLFHITSYAHTNELPCSTKCVEYLDQLRTCSFLRRIVLHEVVWSVSSNSNISLTPVQRLITRGTIFQPDCSTCVAGKLMEVPQSYNSRTQASDINFLLWRKENFRFDGVCLCFCIVIC